MSLDNGPDLIMSLYFLFLEVNIGGIDLPKSRIFSHKSISIWWVKWPDLFFQRLKNEHLLRGRLQPQEGPQVCLLQKANRAQGQRENCTPAKSPWQRLSSNLLQVWGKLTSFYAISEKIWGIRTTLIRYFLDKFIISVSYLVTLELSGFVTKVSVMWLKCCNNYEGTLK